ncbi:SprT family zinc-dependent metalloprotease [Orbaceae bacterium ac157xtp]
MNSHKNIRIPIHLHNQVITCLRKNLLLASHFFNISFNEPSIKYLNKGSIAGSAYLNKWEIQLNTNMLLENQQRFINEVIPHELAHLIAFKIYGKVKPHGKEWQHIMQTIFLLEPNRTHKFKIPITTKRATFHYACECQTHELSVIRHNRIQSSKATYFCNKCKTALKPVESN